MTMFRIWVVRWILDSPLCKKQSPSALAGMEDCEPVNSGLGAELRPLVAQDPVVLVNSLCEAPSSSGPSQSPFSGSEANALALFNATLDDLCPLPTPVINFDEDALITSLIKVKKVSALGGKLNKLQNKKNKLIKVKKVSALGGKLNKLQNKKNKQLATRVLPDDVCSDDDSVFEALHNPNLSPGDFERRFGRCVPRNDHDITVIT